MARRSKFGRFQVWNQPSDSWKHTDQAYNLDILDQMFGGPSQSPTHGVGDDFSNPTTTSPSGVSQWLHPEDTTQITNFGNRTLYNIIRALDHNDVPLGAVFAWWRPSTAVPLPSGCVPGDGSTYTGAANHSYVPYGLTSITVPDLRNVMIIGAYETDTNSSTTALNRDGNVATSPSVDTATAGPGIGTVGGTNVPRSLAHTHAVGTLLVASHTHAITDHTHSIQNHYHGMEHSHYVLAPNYGMGFVTMASGGFGRYVDLLGDHTHGLGSVVPQGFWSALGDGSGRTGIGTTIGGTQGSSEGMFSPGLATGAAAPLLSGSTATALTSTEILSRYVGLMYMVKIRKDGPLHNTVFSPGP